MSFKFKNYRIFKLLFTAIITILAVHSASHAFQRKVMIEEFTSSTCYTCYTVSDNVHEIFTENANLIVPLAYHVNYPNPGDDPWYVDNSTDNQSRMQFYGVSSTPRFYLDGESLSLNSLDANISARSEVDAPVALTMEAAIQNDLLTAVVQVETEEDLDQELTSLILHVALKEKYYNYRHRTSQTDHYNAMIKLLPDGDGTGFDIDAAETKTFTFEEDISDWGWHDLEMDNLALVAYVQAADDEILQAEMSDISDELEVEGSVQDAPQSFVLNPAYPNPFNSTTRIQYNVPEAGLVSVQIFDIMGRQIQEVSKVYQTAGEHQFSLHGDNLPSGVYHVKVSSALGSAAQSVVLIK